MATTWSDLATRYLLTTTTCPRCDAPLTATVCGACGADVGGEAGAAVWRASLAAADALRARQVAIGGLPTIRTTDAAEHAPGLESLGLGEPTVRSGTPGGPAVAPVAPAVAPVAPAVAPVAPAAGPVAPEGSLAGSVAPTPLLDIPSLPDAAPLPAPARAASDESPVSVSSVLAVAGAALVATAAIVFAFLTPDLAFGVRTAVIAGVTLVFGVGAWLLYRRGARFSAEALGALAAVFLVLDVQALVEAAPDGTSGWWFAAGGTAVAAAALLGLGWALRLRAWWWSGLVGFAVVPAMLGFAAADVLDDGAWSSRPVWAWAIGFVGAAAAAVAARRTLRLAGRRFEGTLRGTRITLDVLQAAATVVVAPLVAIAWISDATAGALGGAALVAVLAVLAAVSGVRGAIRFWGWAAGALAATAAALAVLAVPVPEVWFLAIAPAAVAIVVALSGWLLEPFTGSSALRVRAVQSGALSVGAVSVLPAAQGVVPTIGSAMAALASGVGRGGGDATRGLPADVGLAMLLGIAVVAGGVAALGLAARRAGEASAPFARGTIAGAGWLAIGASTLLIGWTGFVPWGQALIGIALALIATAAVVVLRRPAASPAMLGGLRVPLTVLAHLALVEAAMLSWADPATVVPVGAGIAATLLVVARTVPRSIRPLHLAVAYGYALVLLATALDRVGVGTLPVISLTATAASLVALAVTLVPRVGPRTWQAVLAVTAIPFLIGVASVLVERSGWTALSTGVTFLLALALVLTRRQGLHHVVRVIAAALLVPALAVVVVSLGAQMLESSGSPVVLPVIAAIVAVALSASAAGERHVIARGIGADQAADLRTWFEVAVFTTAVIAVVLAYVREAAGLGTAVSVLVILGFGGAGARVFAGRRYGWWVAAAGWTGALWTVWAMLGVEVLEPYTLPPAIAAAIVAAVLVARTGRGAVLFGWALAVALAPSILVLAFGAANIGATPEIAWRTWGLLAAAVVLVALGARIAAGGRLGALRVPLLIGGGAAATAGTLQAVRWGLGIDDAPGWFAAASAEASVMAPALVLSVAAASLAALAARALRSGVPAEHPIAVTRWLYAPALVLLAAGPITAIRRDWFAIWTLWALMAALLVLAVVTVARARTARPVLPPFWFTYALAWATGVAGWSARDLRVEVFSLPLGLAVVAAGVIGLRAAAAAAAAAGAGGAAGSGAGASELPAAPGVGRSLDSWPLGFTGSWPLLGPGIVLTLLPSVLATGTDPQLYRPIMVIALALVAILVGSSRRLAAPFVLGLAVLPLENIVVFGAQLDRTVGAMPWWITLATAGAVLLAIAAGAERRTSRGGVAARLRELR